MLVLFPSRLLAVFIARSSHDFVAQKSQLAASIELLVNSKKKKKEIIINIYEILDPIPLLLTPLNLSGDCTILDFRLSQSCLSPAKLAFVSA